MKDTIKEAGLRIRAINHDTRIEIIDLLRQIPCMTVTDIYIKLRLGQSECSQHLSVLRQSGILKTERQGKYIYYSLDERKYNNILKSANQMAAA